MKRAIGNRVKHSAVLLAAAALGWSAAAVAQGMQPATPSTPAVARPAAAEPMKVVVQVSDDDPRTWNLALNNLRNLQSALGASNVVAELVAYGPGIGMLQRDSSVQARIAQALGDGVRVVACENTMRGHKLTPPDMIPGIGYVPSGVVEIVQRERDGYSYLRP
ncbi:MAG: DsrE family protein [Burkholderiaceae bacterium]|nr:DsrE family protein [Burkholderiaceae bacterium]